MNDEHYRPDEQTIAKVRELVGNGARLLDQQFGPDYWVELVDLDRLDMSIGAFDAGEHDCGCVCSQLDYYQRPEGEHNGLWNRTFKRLTGVPDCALLDYQEAVNCGFLTNAASPDFRDLDWGWTELITERREQGS